MGDPGSILRSLNEARNICLATPATYPQVIPGVLPVIGAQQHLDLRRWGSDFLAETFASPVVSGEDKQKLSLLVLDTLRSYQNRREEIGEDEDPAVIKSAVQCAASIYPYIFRHTLSHPDTTEVWARMASIKSTILRTMDDSAPGVRICGVKFISRVVLVQTPGLIADPRRPELNEISLALLGRDHAVLQPSQLEAEASGLLDRLLGVLQDNSSDALVVTATLNSLAALVHRRASISNKILMTVLNFNPLTPAKAGLAAMGGRERVALKSMTKTTMSFLVNVLKRNPNHALALRLQQRTEQLKHSMVEIFSESGPGKRSAPDEPTDGLDNNKRARLNNEVTNGTTAQQQPPQQSTSPQPLPPGEVSYRELFTLNPDPSAASFHVEAIPLHIVNQLVLPLLGSIDSARLTAALTAVQRRYLEFKQRPPLTALQSAMAVLGEEDEDYDPGTEMTLAGDRAAVMNGLDQAPPQGQMNEGPIQPITLEPGPPLTLQEKEQYGKIALTRVFETLANIDKDVQLKPGKKVDEAKGFNRLASTNMGHDREGWIMLLTRLATRTTLGLNDTNETLVKQENSERSLVKNGQSFTLADGIRDSVLAYVMDDFRRRIDVAIMWLNEEWFCDRLLYQQRNTDESERPTMLDGDLPNYTHYLHTTLDRLIPFLDTGKDGRTLIRFLSEIPEIDGKVLDKVCKLADDPELVQMCSQVLLYLIMFRPPVRSMAIERAVGVWRRGGDARAAFGKVVGRWAPEVLKEEEGGAGGEVKGEA
ncbi:hypothetical protein LTR62_005057 [Meristemomyces frigidus]|uniref:Symplekin/Pta1 N-terminal domain-containing protein n=1 Tax=Meristemomyces frigidus TaxID=1508187 RepID=A0AAN7TQZ9_9PEZI|nr:hypothetical protein LTR62_005057 [Meristemomyces frigidus]